MNADNGSAIFGKKTADKNSGQIILDPSNNKALLFSSNYFDNYKEDGLPSSYSKPSETYEKDGQTYYYQGMLIDLTTPQIRFRSGKFEVNSEGHLTAKGGGSIAGWNISDTQLKSYNDTVILNSGAKEDNDIVFKAGSKFEVKADGTLTATNGTFSGSISASSISGGTINGTEITGSTISGNTITGGTISGTAITGGSLDIGNGTFKVTSDGALTATGAYISGSIVGSTITGGTISGTNIIGGRLYNSGQKAYAEIGTSSGNYGDFAMYRDNGNRVFRFYDEGTLLTFYGLDVTVFGVGSISKTIYAYNSWDFTNATVTGIRATFG